MNQFSKIFKKFKFEIVISLVFIILVLFLFNHYFGIQLFNQEIPVEEYFTDNARISIEEFINNNGLFSFDNSQLVLRKAIYEIDETIVVPVGTYLLIEAGVVLEFAEGVSLFSYSPITAIGTEDEPILFVSQSDLKWGVVGLIDTEKSTFNYVTFEKGSMSTINGQEVFGTLSLVDSNVEIMNSEFVDLFGNDGVWVRNGNVVIKNNFFKNHVSDCLDLDGGSGEISNNQFLDCGDEGIDLSENYNLRVFDNVIVNAKNSAIDADNDLDELLSQNTIR